MVRFLLPFLILPLITCNPLQLHLLSPFNASFIAPDGSSALNATRLTTHNDCFDHSTGHLFTTTKSDCEEALDQLVDGKPLIEIRSFGYQGRGLTDRLPLEADYRSCTITLMMFDLDKRLTMTYAEIYAELLGPEGVLKECLGPRVPAVDALGGQTVMGPRNMMIADVTGRPYKAVDQNSR